MEWNWKAVPERTKKRNKKEVDTRKRKDRLHSIAMDSVPLRIIITAIIVVVNRYNCCRAARSRAAARTETHLTFAST
jgi:hypothetical protein